MAATRKRIVFVDDEPAILSALRTLLYKERQRWDMVFVGGGAEALAVLRAAPADVIVSDMRMPGMDGATLLAHVRSEFPTIARIVLSGHAEPESVERVQPSLHEFLAKPCGGTALRDAIERALAAASYAPAPGL
jgi:DNA-binding NtrC family response regulator